MIISEGREILGKLGVEVNNSSVLSLLSDHGVRVDEDKRRAYLTDELIDGALASVLPSFKLYDIAGEGICEFEGYNIYFTPGSSAKNILDYDTGKIHKPTLLGYIKALFKERGTILSSELEVEMGKIAIEK